MEMVKVVLVALDPEQSWEEVNDLLRRDYMDYIIEDARIVTSPARAEQGRCLGSSLRKESTTDPAWSITCPSEECKSHLNRLLQPLLESKSRAVVIVTSPVLQKLASVYDPQSDPANPWAVISVTSGSTAVLRTKNEVFPRNALRAACKAIKSQILEKARGNSGKQSATKPSVKATTELSKSLDEFRERMKTAIDRSQTQTEERLKKIENALWKKAQDKLQKLDDCEKSIQPLTSDLESLKNSLETPSRLVSIRKKIDSLTTLLSKCQTELREFERNKYTYEDDEYQKPLPLHILGDVTITDSIVYIKVVNMKDGRYDDVQLEIQDELGQVELIVTTVVPGIQRVCLPLQMDLYVVKQIRIVIKRVDREISNKLVIELEDAQPPPPPPAEPKKKGRRPLDDLAKSSAEQQTEDCKESENPLERSQPLTAPSHFPTPSPPFLSDSSHFGPPSFQSDMMEVPDVSSSEMNEQEREAYTTLEGFFSPEFMERERGYFLSIMRGPYGAQLDVQTLGDLMSQRLPS